jgi:hypothetical protein
VPFSGRTDFAYADLKEMAMQSFMVYLMLKILPESLTWPTSLFILEREGFGDCVSCSHADEASREEVKAPIPTVQDATTSAAF